MKSSPLMLFPNRHDSESMTWMLVNRSWISIGRHMVIPNAYWGMGLEWEADLLVVSEAGYLTEIEIKVSKSDLLADHQKQKFYAFEKRRRRMIKQFYYAVPEDLEPHFPESYADIAGLIVVPDDEGKLCRVRKKAPMNSEAKKLTEEKLIKAGRLLGMRYWEQFNRQYSRG